MTSSSSQNSSVMRRQKSAGMEGRRLPSLPAGAIIGEGALNGGHVVVDSLEGPLPSPEGPYEKVGNPDTFC